MNAGALVKGTWLTKEVVRDLGKLTGVRFKRSLANNRHVYPYISLNTLRLLIAWLHYKGYRTKKVYKPYRKPTEENYTGLLRWLKKSKNLTLTLSDMQELVKLKFADGIIVHEVYQKCKGPYVERWHPTFFSVVHGLSGGLSYTLFIETPFLREWVNWLEGLLTALKPAKRARSTARLNKIKQIAKLLRTDAPTLMRVDARLAGELREGNVGVDGFKRRTAP